MAGSARSSLGDDLHPRCCPRSLAARSRARFPFPWYAWAMKTQPDTQPDVDLESKYGPNWRGVDVVVQTVARATEEQITQLAAAWSAVQNPERVAARDKVIAWDAVWDAARVAMWDATWAATWESVCDAARVTSLCEAWDSALIATWEAVRNAATAAVVKDLIGQHGFTQEHYDELMVPWIAVFGDPFESADID